MSEYLSDLIKLKYQATPKNTSAIHDIPRPGYENVKYLLLGSGACISGSNWACVKLISEDNENLTHYFDGTDGKFVLNRTVTACENFCIINSGSRPMVFLLYEL